MELAAPAVSSAIGSPTMLEPAGAEASKVLELFWLLLSGSVVIWLLIVGATWYATHWPPRAYSERLGRRLILFGGVVVPTVLLLAVAVLGLSLMAELRSAVPEMTVRITGEQYWWRAEYLDPDGSVVLETANEIVIPKDAAVALELVTADVIHSFWVPALAGKVDMIPGRVNRLVLEARRTGTFRGQCAEFCGDSHALMALRVRVLDPPGYAAWQDRERRAAAVPETAEERRGQSLFLAYGCGACHRIRGTPAAGRVGPDLTHLAARARLAADTLANEPASLLSWLRHPQTIKPGVEMPSFAMLEHGQLGAIVGYLRSLE